jgi:ribosome assembly protein SQT1
VTAHPTNPRLAVCGTENDTAVVFSWEDGAHGADARVVATLTGHTDTITQVAFSPNGSILATGGMDGTVRLWNTATWELLHELVDLGGEVEALLWHPTGAVLVGGGAGASAVLWNAAKGTTAQYFAGHRDAVRCLAWSLDVKKLVTGSADGGVALFNPKTAEMEVNVSRDMSPDGAGVTALSVLPSASAPQETIVLAGCEDGTLHIVSLAGKGRVLKHLPELHSQGVESVTQGPPALGFIATCSCDGLLILWNLHDFTVRSTFKCGEGFTKVMWVAASLVVACTDGDVRVWDSRGDETAPPTRHLLGHRRLVLDVALNADATHIVTAADDGSARVFPLA